MDFILFFTGLAFFFFGFTFLLIYQIEKKEHSWKFLASFGILRGIYQWLLLVQWMYFHHAVLSAAIIGLDILSFVLLFEFGRRGLREGKKPSRMWGLWMYVPLILLFAYAFFAGGGHILDTVLHLTVSLLACLLAGIYFWHYAAKRGMEKMFMHPIAVLFVLYGASQFFIDEKAFAVLTGFPIHLVYNVLAFLIFLFAWLQYLAFLKHDIFSQQTETKTLSRTQKILSFLVLVPIVYVISFFFLNFLGSLAKMELKNESNAIVSVASENFKHVMITAKNTVSLLVSFPEFVEILSETSSGNVDQASIVLDQCSVVSIDGVCYIMNTDGVVIASSNRFAPDSFMGKNYAFRPYFTEAMQDKPGEYFALGVTSNIPGYYAAHAIKNVRQKIVGVAVVKINLNAIEDVLHTYQHMCFVSPEGVVFLSGDPRFKGNTFLPLSESEKQTLVKRQQFGSSTFQPLFETYPLKDTVMRSDKDVVYVTSAQINGGGWSVVYFHGAQKIYQYRLFGIVLILLFYIFIIASLIILQMLKRNAIFAYFASVIYASQDAVIGKKLNGEIEVWNEGAERLYGYTSKEMIGKTCDVLHPTNERDHEKTMMERIRQGGAIENFEMQHLNKKGELIDVSVSMSPIKDVNDEIVGVSLVVRDISRAKKLEKMKAEFVSIASHQLRTPLTGIKWFSELLLNGRVGGLKNAQKEYVKQIAESNQRMINLVNDLLEVSHIDAEGKFVMHKKQEDFSEILEQVVEQLSVMQKTKHVHIRLGKTCKSKILLTIDSIKIQQVLQNLLFNAIKFSHENGIIDISCNKEKKQLVCSIRDRGIGIPAQQQARIFEKFFRADNSVDAGGGTGLGLFIAKSVVEAHGGKIWFESEEGKGTTFFLSLPLA